MPRRKTEIIGGGRRKKKPDVAGAFKKLGHDIDKGFKEKISRPANKEFFKPAEKALQKAGAEIGKFTNEQLLPGVVSVGIPLAGTALGALGAEFGLPPEITSKLSENLLKEFIPKQYQSDNKYVGMISNAIDAGLSGDQNKAMQVGQDFLGSVSGDIGKLVGKNKIKQSVPTSENFDPEDPYSDLMKQLISNYQTLPQNQQMDQQQDDSSPVMPNQPNIDYNALSDAVYKGSDISNDADSLTITSPPYQQREGSSNGLLGAGIKKKRRGRKKKEIIDDITEYKPKQGTLVKKENYVIKQPKKKEKKVKRVEIIHKLPYERFQHAENASLKQLLESHNLNEQKNLNKNVSDMAKYIKNDVENVKRNMETLQRERDFYREALGAGIKKPQKGSQEMKDRMAKIRAMKKKK